MDTGSKSKDWIKPTKANLYHKDKLVGVITNISPTDMFQWAGDIQLTAGAADYQAMIDYFNDEARQREPDEPDESELPFNEALLDHWSLEDENGRREILYPRITGDGEVNWRDQA